MPAKLPKAPAAKEPTAKNATNGGSFTALQTIEAITQAFLERELESQKKKEFGQLEFLNSLNVLFVVAKAICANYENSTFGLEEFLTYSKPFDLEFPIVSQFFADWTEELQKTGRLRSVPTCYDREIFQFV